MFHMSNFQQDKSHTTVRIMFYWRPTAFNKLSVIQIDFLNVSKIMNIITSGQSF